MDNVNTRIALLKKPLLSLFAYEVSCRVRVEKTTLADFSQIDVSIALPEQSVHPKTWFPRSWVRFGLFIFSFIFYITHNLCHAAVELPQAYDEVVRDPPKRICPLETAFRLFSEKHQV